jgi:hypothetical protein
MVEYVHTRTAVLSFQLVCAFIINFTFFVVVICLLGLTDAYGVPFLFLLPLPTVPVQIYKMDDLLLDVDIQPGGV